MERKNVVNKGNKLNWARNHHKIGHIEKIKKKTLKIEIRKMVHGKVERSLYIFATRFSSFFVRCRFFKTNWINLCLCQFIQFKQFLLLSSDLTKYATHKPCDNEVMMMAEGCSKMSVMFQKVRLLYLFWNSTATSLDDVMKFL